MLWNRSLAILKRDWAIVSLIGLVQVGLALAYTTIKPALKADHTESVLSQKQQGETTTPQQIRKSAKVSNFPTISFHPSDAKNPLLPVKHEEQEKKVTGKTDNVPTLPVEPGKTFPPLAKPNTPTPMTFPPLPIPEPQGTKDTVPLPKINNSPTPSLPPVTLPNTKPMFPPVPTLPKDTTPLPPPVVPPNTSPKNPPISVPPLPNLPATEPQEIPQPIPPTIPTPGKSPISPPPAVEIPQVNTPAPLPTLPKSPMSTNPQPNTFPAPIPIHSQPPVPPSDIKQESTTLNSGNNAELIKALKEAKTVGVNKIPVNSMPPVPVEDLVKEPSTNPTLPLPINSQPEPSNIIQVKQEPAENNFEPKSAKPGPSPWKLKLEIIGGRTHLSARIEGGEEMLIECGKLNLARPNGNIEATGKVQFKSAKFSGSCDQLTINWQEERMMMNGNVRYHGQDIKMTGTRLTLHLGAERNPTTGLLHDPQQKQDYKLSVYAISGEGITEVQPTGK